MATLNDVVEELRKQNEADKDRKKKEEIALNFQETLAKAAKINSEAIDIISKQSAAAKKQLADAQTDEQRESAEDTISVLLDSINIAVDEEQAREDAKWQNKLLAGINAMGESVKSMEEGFSSKMEGFAKGATLIGLLSLFVDPTLLIDTITYAGEVIDDFLTMISDLLAGDLTSIFSFMSEHLLVSAGAALYLVTKLGIFSGLISTIGGIFSTAITVFGWIKKGALLLSAAASGILTSMTAFLAPLIPIAAIVGAIGLAIYGLYKGVSDAMDVFEETGSYMEAFKTLISSFWGNTVGLVMEGIKWLVARIAGLFGFDGFAEWLDGIDMVQLVKDALGGLIDMIIAIPGKIQDYVQDMLPTWLGGRSEEEKIAAEKARTIAAQEEKAAAEEKELKRLETQKQMLEYEAVGVNAEGEAITAATIKSNGIINTEASINNVSETEGVVAVLSKEERTLMAKQLDEQISAKKEVAKANAEQLELSKLQHEDLIKQMEHDNKSFLEQLDSIVGKSKTEVLLEGLNDTLEEQAELDSEMAQWEKELVDVNRKMSTASTESTLWFDSEKEDYQQKAESIEKQLDEAKKRKVVIDKKARNQRATLSKEGITVPEAAAGDNRSMEAMDYFVKQGYTPEQAAGIVGNLDIESRFDTKAVGDGGKAHGIAQWHPDRQAIFEKQFGKEVLDASFQEQLAFVNYELQNNESRANSKILSAETASDAAKITDRYYERSAGLHTSERIESANAHLEQYNAMAVTAPSLPLQTNEIVDPVRYAQAENSALTASESATSAGMNASMSTSTNTNVSAPTTNITEMTSPDNLAREFAHYPD